jgi:hypothetical protein
MQCTPKSIFSLNIVTVSLLNKLNFIKIKNYLNIPISLYAAFSYICARAAAAADIKNNTHVCASSPAAAPFFDNTPLSLSAKCLFCLRQKHTKDPNGPRHTDAVPLQICLPFSARSQKPTTQYSTLNSCLNYKKCIPFSGPTRPRCQYKEAL